MTADERTTADALLAETAEDLYEHAPCGYLSTLADGRIVRVNHTLLGWLGYTREELVGRTFAELLTIGGRMYHETHYAPLLQMHGRVSEIAFDLVGKSGRRLAALVTTVERRAAAGEAVVYRSTIFDASERRSYERELVAARRAAEQAARERADFLAMISHEIRTPLTLTLGSAEERLAAADAGPDEQAAWAVVRRSGGRILRLVDALLEFARLESGRVEARFRPTELAALTTEIVDAFRPAIERGGLRLVTRVEPLAEPVHVDPEMWEKIVLNLLANALKYTFAGEIEVALASAGGEAVLSVRDTGTGIPERELPRLFEKFHRVRDARGRTREGTGIGLALVRELLRLHAGTIAVASEVGVGSTFTARVPLGADHLPPDRVVAAGAAGPSRLAAAIVDEAAQWARPLPRFVAAPDPIDGPRPRVLVVDDSADLRAFLGDLLRGDHDVEAVGDGLAALERARRAPPDLIVSDVVMPGLDGAGLVAALRADPRTRLVPVILLSSGAGEEARVRGLEAGADDYVVKPFSPRELRARVRAHIELARLRVAAARDRERFRAAFASAGVGMAITDLRGRFLQVNDAFSALAGYAAEDLLHLGLVDITHPTDRAGDLAAFAGLVAGADPATAVGERRYLRPDGGQVWVHASAALVRDVDGSPLHAIVVVGDITARKLGEAERARLLEREQAARAQAEAAVRAKDEFMAMLGHELRNPLAPTVTALQLLRLRGQQSRELDIIERQVTHMTRLVDDLLDVARIASGKVELRLGVLDLADVVHEAIEMTRPILAQRRHTVVVDVPPGLRLIGDPIRLAQVGANLLTNAAKYSDPGRRIWVSGRRRSIWVELSVRDEGIGVPEDMRDRIFDLFVQQPQTLDRAVGGLGLGLAIVRNLVNLHGGRVRLVSDGPGLGSEFVVELPAAADP